MTRFTSPGTVGNDAWPLIVMKLEAVYDVYGFVVSQVPLLGHSAFGPD